LRRGGDRGRSSLFAPARELSASPRRVCPTADTANPSRRGATGSVNCYRLSGLSSAIERRSAFARFGATRGLEDSANLPDPAIIAQELSKTFRRRHPPTRSYGATRR